MKGKLFCKPLKLETKFELPQNALRKLKYKFGTFIETMLVLEKCVLYTEDRMSQNRQKQGHSIVNIIVCPSCYGYSNRV